MKVLFDTSVLVPALIVNHPKHSVCFSRLKAAESKQIQGFISTHSLAETYSVITRLPIQPRITPEQAQSIIVDVLQYFEVIPLFSNDYQIAIAQMATLNILISIKLQTPLFLVEFLGVGCKIMVRNSLLSLIRSS